jgi:N-acetylglucosaminyldiphosphoundecaprenol N-acetyl-beta-D-mannosaminyltransferase
MSMAASGANNVTNSWTEWRPQTEECASVEFLGYRVGSFTMDEAVVWVERALHEPELHHIAVLNANKMWLADRNPDLRSILLRSELLIPEYAIVWGCKVMGTPLRGHIGGIMLLKALLPRLELLGVPVYFLGAQESVLKHMVERLRLQFPALAIAGSHSGYFEPSESKQVVDAINRSGAKILFVAMGSPRQELWIEAQRGLLGVRVAMGVGGSFDVLAGIKKDAPPWVRHGGEWLYRLAQDPRALWKRYLKTNSWFVTQVFQEKLFPGKQSRRRETP